MSTSAVRVPTGRYGFRNVARMEWIKLRSLRSTWWTLGLTVAGAAGIAMAVGTNTVGAHEDLTNNALAGVLIGLLLVGVLGVLTVTSEYTSGMIRATLAASPRRWLVLAAKAGVFGLAALVAGEVAAFGSFFVFGGLLGHGLAAPALGQPNVLRAVALTGASLCLVGLLGLGLGAIIRHTAAAVAVLVGVVYVGEAFIGQLFRTVGQYLPIFIVANSLSVTQARCAPHATVCRALPAWEGLGLLALYAAVALLVGGWLLTRRDA
jgi:ABC-2 type transport system permease protein